MSLRELIFLFAWETNIINVADPSFINLYNRILATWKLLRYFILFLFFYIEP